MLKFQLQSVLDYRLKIEEKCLIEYSEQLRSVENEKKVLEALKEKRATLMDQFLQNQDNETTADDIGMYISFLRRMLAKEKEQNAIIAQAESVLEEKRSLLLEAVKNRKALENLKAKRIREYKEGILEKERKQLDEFGITRFQGGVDNEESDHIL